MGFVRVNLRRISIRFKHVDNEIQTLPVVITVVFKNPLIVMYFIVITVKQGSASSFSEISVGIDIWRERNFGYSQCSLLSGGEVAICHINGKIIFKSTDGGEVLKRVFSNETAKEIMNRGDILRNSVKRRRIEACECQALSKMFYMGAGWPEI
jgi:hypothetical protein